PRARCDHSTNLEAAPDTRARGPPRHRTRRAAAPATPRPPPCSSAATSAPGASVHALACPPLQSAREAHLSLTWEEFALPSSTGILSGVARFACTAQARCPAPSPCDAPARHIGPCALRL